MCGIFGYSGPDQAQDRLVEGLDYLSYRGYDSFGIAVVDSEHGIRVQKKAGTLESLRELVRSHPLKGTTGIGHNRWATHGKPTDLNAHPHVSFDGRFALVHNGVIENHSALRNLLAQKDIVCVSETDSEVLVQLIAFFYRDCRDVTKSIQDALKLVEGTFAIAILCADLPNMVIVARRGSPIIVGIRDVEGFVASDEGALYGKAATCRHLQDDEIAFLEQGDVRVVGMDGQAVMSDLRLIEATLDELALGDYEHHMYMEIFEQPAIIAQTLSGRLRCDKRSKVTLGGLMPIRSELQRCSRILLFGCGTAFNAALIGEHLMEALANIPTHAEQASELTYRGRIIEPRTVAIAVTQSGETADTIGALKAVTLKGALPLGIVNVVGSHITHLTRAGVYTRCGREIGVASTKAFTGQVAALAMFAIHMAQLRGYTDETLSSVVEALHLIPTQVADILTMDDMIASLADRFAQRKNWLYLGRGVNFPVALEGALKLKEVSYIHAEGMPAAEMKHGPIALVEDGMPVVVIAPRDAMFDKILTNISEVVSRGAHVIVITDDDDARLRMYTDHIVVVPRTHELLSPLLTVIPLQLLAYHAARCLGCDVDKPRNLAKSVTVE